MCVGKWGLFARVSADWKREEFFCRVRSKVEVATAWKARLSASRSKPSVFWPKQPQISCHLVDAVVGASTKLVRLQEMLLGMHDLHPRVVVVRSVKGMFWEWHPWCSNEGAVLEEVHGH